jgi:hypothetical protein
MLGPVIAVVAGIVLLSIGLAIVEFRRFTGLAFRCARCGHEFQQPPHHDYPRECPRCHAADWAV